MFDQPPHLGLEVEDPYGPGADLMISLFSIAILLLGIMGVGDGMSESAAAIGARQAPETRQTSPSDTPAIATPPLKLISPEELAAESQRRRAAEARAAELSRLDADLRRTINTLNDRIARMEKELGEADGRLQAERDKKPDNRVILLENTVAVADLQAFLDAPSAIGISFSAADVANIRAAVMPPIPNANQLYIETSVPPQIFAFLTEKIDGAQAMGRLNLLSTGLGQAYQQAFARQGIPLACISLLVRSIEETPGVQEAAVLAGRDPIPVFQELLTIYAGSDRAEAGRAEAVVRVQLGADRAYCDSAALSERLSNLKPD